MQASIQCTENKPIEPEKPKKRTGKLIAIEGIDGIGKTTLVEALKKDFDKRFDGKFHFMKEPTCEFVQENLKREDPIAATLLFAADRAIHTPSMNRRLEKGVNIITDRYYFSNMVYQSVFLEGVIDHPGVLISSIHRGWLIRPDVNILLTTNDSKKVINRVKKRQTMSFLEERTEQIDKKYRQIAADNPRSWVVVSADQTKDAIREQVSKIILKMVGLDDNNEG